jgi:hypothetical protein
VAINRYQVALSTLLLLCTTEKASASCLDKTCVDVFTADNQLVITAQKGSQKQPIKPAAKSISKPVVKKVVAKPAPIIKPKVIRQTVKVAPVVSNPITKPKSVPIKKPVIKSVSKPKKTVTASLSDRLTKLLPTGDINYQPSEDPLVNLPV